MSAADTAVDAAIARVRDLVATGHDEAALADALDPTTIRALLTLSVRLYATKCETLGEEFTPVEEHVTPTDAAIACSALLRSQGLNPFDLTLWFARGAAPADPTKQR